jgi:serine/threonine protein phosphatase PrpC
MVPAAGAAPLFYFDAHMEAPLTLAVAGGTVSLFLARGPDRADANEDAALVLPLGSTRAVLAVADGASGHPAGELAARAALESIEASVRSRDAARDDLRSAILDGIEMANESVRAMGMGAATTLAVVEIEQNWARAYHVGDSGVLVVGQRGRLKARTIDHSPAGHALEAGLLDEDEALAHTERHLLTNMVGTPDMRIDVGPSVPLAAHDTLLIASDGLFDNLTFDEIVSRIRKGALAEAVAALARRSRARMAGPPPGGPSKPDDLAVVAFRRGAGPSRADAL